MFIHFHKTVIFLVMTWYSLVMAYNDTGHTGWTNKQSEVYFLVDSSASIWIMDYSKLLRFVADLVSDMDIGPSATRVGLGVFSGDHRLHIPVNNNLTPEKLQEEIMKAPYLKGNTFLSRALKGMLERGLTPSITRPGVPLITVLLTDGMSRHKQLTADNATLAKREGIFLFTVGIGNGIDQDELRDIASDPKDEFNYHVANFDHLKDIRRSLSYRMSEVDLLQSDEGTCGHNSKVDTVFIFDEAALGAHDSHKVKDFIATLVNDFSMNSGNVRVGVISSTCRHGDKMLGQYVTKEDFIAGLQAKDGPDISGLVKRARLESFLPENGARFDAEHRIVLILQDEVRKWIETIRQVSKAKHAGIKVFVIQLGASYEKRLINRMVSHIDNSMYVDNANDLTEHHSIKKFTNSFCRDL